MKKIKKFKEDEALRDPKRVVKKGTKKKPSLKTTPEADWRKKPIHKYFEEEE